MGREGTELHTHATRHRPPRGKAEDDGTPPDSTDRDDTDEAPRPKGLWSMMEPNRDDAPSETIVSTAQLPGKTNRSNWPKPSTTMTEPTGR
ncbi:MAG: hypothetical protein Ct9H300mP1_15300 [Planctomycetaceae bacterium]|nr:MAG: hypothetical protein Ct9H300mP1_15300 [Planctomycetaceae bacterium]